MSTSQLRTTTGPNGRTLVHGYLAKFGDRVITAEHDSEISAGLEAYPPVLVEGGEFAGVWVARSRLSDFETQHASRYRFNPDRDRIEALQESTPASASASDSVGADSASVPSGESAAQLIEAAMIEGAIAGTNHVPTGYVTSHGGFETGAIGSSNEAHPDATQAQQRVVRGTAGGGQRKAKP